MDMTGLIEAFWDLPTPVSFVVWMVVAMVVLTVLRIVGKFVWMVMLFIWNVGLIVWSGVRWVYWLLMGWFGWLVNTSDGVYRMVDGKRVIAKQVPVVKFTKGQKRVIPVPELSLSKQVALRSRREWNSKRNTLAPIVLARDEWYCQWCDLSLDEENWSIDHIIPISKGGTNELHNLQAMCRSCNSMKGTKTDGWGKFWNRVAA
jgi:HNH endonuclease